MEEKEGVKIPLLKIIEVLDPLSSCSFVQLCRVRGAGLRTISRCIPTHKLADSAESRDLAMIHWYPRQ